MNAPSPALAARATTVRLTAASARNWRRMGMIFMA